ncbi:MAG: hypothetical protein AAGJ31_12825 [Verrucomicrobiota bacterium]
MKSVLIEKADSGQLVTVIADGTVEGATAISQEDAIASLGSKAKRYVVETWAKDGAEEITYVAGMSGVT